MFSDEKKAMLSDESKKVEEDILNILSKAEEAQMYGSIEIYIEGGNVTQITQRIIKKISKPGKRSSSSQKIKTPKIQLGEESASAATVKYS